MERAYLAPRLRPQLYTWMLALNARTEPPEIFACRHGDTEFGEFVISGKACNLLRRTVEVTVSLAVTGA